MLPVAIALPLAVLAALGWVHWRQPVARRAGITLAVYALFGLVTARLPLRWQSPASVLGVVFAPMRFAS